MAEVDKATVDRARTTLLAYLNDAVLREEQYFASLGSRLPPLERYTAAQLATWHFAPYSEWLIAGPPGDNYGSPTYLVSEDTVYRIDLTRESYEQALDNARALKTSRR